ncbi:hypothetical protein Bca52824_093887 [Brassica carinata]|uniref:Large ribosomal subunit protein bL28m n=1 Tax=Brassica carinata TaxID=52824 RepID=A0A8X7TJH1_BRACI|nr:hypothetical protein Bca52824_093887 [Brassica carinata]
MGFGNRSRRCWKPNVQEKRLFSYIFDRHVKVTTHALRCIDKAGGLDEYLLRTSYQKMDTEKGLFWKTKVEQRYAELAKKDARMEGRREARRRMYGDDRGVEEAGGLESHQDDMGG